MFDICSATFYSYHAEVLYVLRQLRHSYRYTKDQGLGYVGGVFCTSLSIPIFSYSYCFTYFLLHIFKVLVY